MTSIQLVSLVLVGTLLQWFSYVVFDMGLVLPRGLALAGFSLGCILTMYHRVFVKKEFGQS